MIKRVLVLGAYGNFGAYITRELSKEPDIQIIIAGRSEQKCREFSARFTDAPNPPEYKALDIEKNLDLSLRAVRPDIVIHTSGPFQGQGFHVAEVCVDYGCHYIDLADAREFVTDITQLDDRAKKKGVTVISGASSVPCLTAAVIDHYLPEFQKLTSIDYGITTAQRTNTGLATAAAVLGYAGKSFATLIRGGMSRIYGWQGLIARKYPRLGYRLLGNCDIPDLTLFPSRYSDLETIRFRAGLEIAPLHLGLWSLSWLVRLGFLKSLAPLAARLLKISRLFDWIGSDKSAFHMEMSGIGKNGKPQTITFYLVAASGHGPYIPSTPSILCAKMLARGEISESGARPCVGVINLGQYLEALKDLDITPLTVHK